MQTLALNDLAADERYRLSFPLRPDLYAAVSRRLSGLPLLVIDGQLRVICGHDYVSSLRRQGRRRIQALQTDLAGKEALFFAFHWKSLFSGFNLYEKLLFVKKTLAFAPAPEIQRRTTIDFSITVALQNKLDKLLQPSWKKLLQSDRVSLRMALRLCTAKAANQKALRGLLAAVSWNDNQQQKIVEIIEEISCREQAGWGDILDSLSISAMTKKEMPQKAIMTALLARRFPERQRFEKEWQNRYASLFATAGIRVTPHPYFEKSAIDLAIGCPDIERALQILEAVKNLACR